MRDLDAARKISADRSAVNIRVTITQLSAARFAKRRGGGQYDLALSRFTSPVLRSRYHLAAALAAAGQIAQARRLVRRRSRLAVRLRRFMQRLPLIPLFHVGVRADVAGTLRTLRRGPWGLMQWEGAHYALQRRSVLVPYAVLRGSELRQHLGPWRARVGE